MHHLFFQVKRSYWGIQNTLRRPLKKIARGITPARVDMLYALERSPWKRGREQRLLPEKLGVVKSVVSRMLQSMEDLGWIRRERAPYDRRRWIVAVTDAGKEVLRRVFARFVKSRLASTWVFQALMGESWKKRTERLSALILLDDCLQRIRDWFRGGGTLYYPWGHPDD